MTFNEKYKPTTQKALFHKDVVSHIRKWIKLQQDLYDCNKHVSNVLFLHGPHGCGKSETTSLLLKSMNVIEIDPNEIRSEERVVEICMNIPSYGSETLIHNLTKSNKKENVDTKRKYSIVLVDNIELCERNISILVETLHNKFNTNIPVILISNCQKIKDSFDSRHYENCHFIDFPKPSLLELTKLCNDINAAENLKLNKEHIKCVIEKSLYDTRQLLFILQQWKFSTTTFESFIKNIESKHEDLDIIQKIKYLCDGNIDYDLEDTLNLSGSEPYTISNMIYQNYPDILSCPDVIKSLETAVHITDSISYSNCLHSYIFSEQRWDLYDAYVINSCVQPSYHIKQYHKIASTQSEVLPVCYHSKPFKDVSNNNSNSWEDIKKITCLNMYSKKFNPSGITSNLFAHLDFLTCTSIAKSIYSNITLVSDYFDKNKKGKNTSKNEKILLCNSLSETNLNATFLHIVKFVYTYKFFEVDIDNIYLDWKSYLEPNESVIAATKIIDNINKLEIKLFKRFLNIFLVAVAGSKLKSHVEMSIKYKVFEMLINDIKNYNTTMIVQRDVDSLIENLENIWKF